VQLNVDSNSYVTLGIDVTHNKETPTPQPAYARCSMRESCNVIIHLNPWSCNASNTSVSSVNEHC